MLAFNALIKNRTAGVRLMDILSQNIFKVYGDGDVVGLGEWSNKAQVIILSKDRKTVQTCVICGDYTAELQPTPSGCQRLVTKHQGEPLELNQWLKGAKKALRKAIRETIWDELGSLSATKEEIKRTIRTAHLKEATI